MEPQDFPLLQRAGVIEAAEAEPPTHPGPPILAVVVHDFRPGWRPLSRWRAGEGRGPAPDPERCAACGARADARCHSSLAEAVEGAEALHHRATDR